MKILIVEDEQALAVGLKFNFEQEGYEVHCAGDGHRALELFRQADPPFDLVILDLMLPSMSGYETCEEIRKIDGQVPILVLSARTLSEDRTRAFDCGTDQYLSKPFALPELLSRVRNLTERRVQRQAGPARDRRQPDVHAFGSVQVDFRKYTVTVGDRVHNLTPLELELLRYFIEHEGNVLSRLQILEDVWDQTADVTTRTIDNFVMRLRRIIEANPAEPRHIVSVRGTGYRFVAEPEAGEKMEAAS
jgi:DNA-binding response OmpR family regulator